jgi:hypothetical protein
MDTSLEIHIEQAQAIVQNLTHRDDCVCIAAIFITEQGYMLGKFPLFTTEDQFCSTVWEYAMDNNIDHLFVTYPSRVFLIDGKELEPADYLTSLEMGSEIMEDCAVLAYYKYKYADNDDDESRYIAEHVWASLVETDLTDWDEYDPSTLRKLT